MAYSWYDDVFLPAEYRALLRELETKIAAGKITKEAAVREVADWKKRVAQIDREAKEYVAKEYPKYLERWGRANGNSTD